MLQRINQIKVVSICYQIKINQIPRYASDKNMFKWNRNLKLSVTISVLILVTVSTMQVSSMIASNGNLDAYDVYAKYTNDQAQSFANDCYSSDISGGSNCANNGLQTQASESTGTITNYQISDTILERNVGDRNVGQANTGDTFNQVDGDVGGDNSQTAGGGNFVGEDQSAAGNCDDCRAGSTENSLSASPQREIISGDETLEEEEQSQDGVEQDNQGINNNGSNMTVPLVLPF
jgi:hypothetical protein